eukprot:15222981-Alexandrium_andersonii.AAC.1
MSASLVGSEMCIRDRSFCARLVLNEQCSATQCRAVPSSAAQWHCWGGAVSYTHLTLPTICSV